MGNQHKGYGSSHGAGRGQQGKGDGGFCVCPQCGYSTRHEAGIPCKTVFCPDCNVSMHRRETPGKTSGINQEPVKDTEPETAKSKTQFPKVVPEKCTACGICIDICPSGAIVMENGKAFIKTDHCRNCMACIKACPEEAIIIA